MKAEVLDDDEDKEDLMHYSKVPLKNLKKRAVDYSSRRRNARKLLSDGPMRRGGRRLLSLDPQQRRRTRKLLSLESDLYPINSDILIKNTGGTVIIFTIFAEPSLRTIFK